MFKEVVVLKVEVKCSWCHVSMGWKDFEFSTQKVIHQPVSHGICKKCFDKEMAKAMPINKNQQMKGTHHDTDSNIRGRNQ